MAFEQVNVKTFPKLKQLSLWIDFDGKFHAYRIFCKRHVSRKCSWIPPIFMLFAWNRTHFKTWMAWQQHVKTSQCSRIVTEDILGQRWRRQVRTKNLRSNRKRRRLLWWPGVKVLVGDFGMPGSRVALVILDMRINHSYWLVIDIVKPCCESYV